MAGKFLWLAMVHGRHRSGGQLYGLMLKVYTSITDNQLHTVIIYSAHIGLSVCGTENMCPLYQQRY